MPVPSDDPAPAGSLFIPQGGSNPRAMPGEAFTAELEVADPDRLHAFVLWAAELFGHPERILAIRLDERTGSAVLDFGPRVTAVLAGAPAPCRWLH